MAKVISFSNQKGGVGKTSTCVNLAAGLALKGKKTLLIDMDPQGNATTGLGFSKNALTNSVYNVLIDELPAASAIHKTTLENLDIVIDEARILTECAIFADRVAIDEELVRLSSHFEAFDAILASDEPIGRKLDFLLQEINRETNTIGSKACDVAIAKIVVEIKSELEKIREQIQNIE